MYWMKDGTDGSRDGTECLRKTSNTTNRLQFIFEQEIYKKKLHRLSNKKWSPLLTSCLVHEIREIIIVIPNESHLSYDSLVWCALWLLTRFFWNRKQNRVDVSVHTTEVFSGTRHFCLVDWNIQGYTKK